MRVAVIDLGKTNAKVAWVDTASARELRVRTMPAPVVNAPPYPHLDVAAIDAFIVDCLENGGAVDAITVTTHGATIALIDDGGELVLPVLDYEHDGPDAVRADYEAVRPSFEQTGSPGLPGGLNVGAQLFWLQREQPADFARASMALTWPQFWVHRLCGEAANDPASLGAHTDLIEPATCAGSSLLHSQGWTRLMPRLCRSGERLGSLCDEMAARTGLPTTTAVHAGIHDSNASLVPHLLSRTGAFSVVSTGTWVIVMVVGGSKVALDPQRDALINIDAFARPVPSARFMGGREHALLTGQRGDAAICSTRAASAVQVDALSDAEAWLLPSTAGGTGPFPHERAAWTMNRELLARTFGEDAVERVIAGYLAAMTLASMDLAGAMGDTVVEGPFAANLDYLNALAAGSGRAVFISESTTGTSIGAAMLVAAPDEPVRVQPVQHDAELHAAWRRYLAGWHDAVETRRSSGALNR